MAGWDPDAIIQIRKNWLYANERMTLLRRTSLLPEIQWKIEKPSILLSIIRIIHHRYIDSFRGLSREVWLLAILMFINRSGTMVIPFLTVYLTQQQGFSLEQAGWVMGSFGLGSLVGVYIGGFLTDRIGPFTVQLWSLMLTGIMFFILQQMDSYLWFNIMIFLTSLISDTFRPANMTAVAQYSAPEKRTRSISLIRLAINAGWGIGPALGGILALHLGYHWIFWLDGATCILSGIFLIATISPKPLIKDEKEENELPAPKKTILSDYPFLIFCALNVLAMLVFFQLFSTIPVFFKTRLLLDEDAIGMIMALNGLLIAAAEMPLVYLLENRVSSLRIIVFGTLLITIAYSVFMVGHWWGLAVISMIIITFGEIFHMPFANAYTMERADNARMGKYMSYYGMSFSLAFILAPITGMRIAEHYGYQALWVIMCLIGILAATGYHFLYRSQYKS